MTYVLTADQMRAAEHRAIADGHPEPELMHLAAEGMAQWIDDQFPAFGESRLAVGLVGPGKNGGDTLVALSGLIERGWSAAACLVERDSLGDLPADPGFLEQIELIHDLSAIEDATVILDGIYGLGGRPALSEPVVDLLGQAAQLREDLDIPVLAVDLPSGIDTDTGEADTHALRADATLTVGFVKAGLLFEPAASLSGEVVTVDIGLEPEAGEATISIVSRESAAAALPERNVTGGKHDFGGLLVIGGAPMYFGAPRLAAEAGLRMGTGIVGAAVPRMLVSTIAIQVPEVVFIPLNDSDPRKSVADITEALTGERARYTAAVLGPGLGQDEPAKALLSQLFGQATSPVTASIGFGALGNDEERPKPQSSALASVPVVLDADALNWLAEEENWPALLTNVTAVLTPHSGEMARLLGVDRSEIERDPRATARTAAQDWGQVVVLKGGYTTIAAPDGRLAIAHRATPELATPGTGDVLAGMIGALLAQGVDPFEAACAAVYTGAEAGRYARHGVSSRSVLARDLIDNLGMALDDLDGSHW